MWISKLSFSTNENFYCLKSLRKKTLFLTKIRHERLKLSLIKSANRANQFADADLRTLVVRIMDHNTSVAMNLN